MQIYRKTFRCSENFPAEVDQEWNVSEGRKVAEHWRVIRRGKGSFEVEIKEYFPAA
jgi:hypothetical protein